MASERKRKRKQGAKKGGIEAVRLLVSSFAFLILFLSCLKAPQHRAPPHLLLTKRGKRRKEKTKEKQRPFIDIFRNDNGRFFFLLYPCLTPASAPPPVPPHTHSSHTKKERVANLRHLCGGVFCVEKTKMKTFFTATFSLKSPPFRSTCYEIRPIRIGRCPRPRGRYFYF